MFNINFNGDLYKCYTYGSTENDFSCVVILEEHSVSDIITSIRKGNNDFIITEGEKEIARFVNFNVLKSIEEQFNYDYGEGKGEVAFIHTEHPTQEDRLNVLETEVGMHGTDIVQLNSDLTGGLNEKQAEIDAANADIRTANNNIAQANSRIDITNEKVSAAEGQIEGHSNDISDIQTMLEITQEALDDIIMHDPINEEA